MLPGPVQLPLRSHIPSHSSLTASELRLGGLGGQGLLQEKEELPDPDVSYGLNVGWGEL